MQRLWWWNTKISVPWTDICILDISIHCKSRRTQWTVTYIVDVFVCLLVPPVLVPCAVNFIFSKYKHMILQKLKVPHHVHKSTRQVPALSQISPFTPLHPVSLRAILILFSHLCLGLLIMIFLLGFPTKPCVSPLSHAHHVPWPSHPWFDYSGYVRFLVEECKLSISSNMQISQTSCTSHFWSNHLPQHPFRVLAVWQTKFHTHAKQHSHS